MTTGDKVAGTLRVPFALSRNEFTDTWAEFRSPERTAHGVCLLPSREHILQNVSVNIGQPPFRAVVVERKSFVLQP